MKNYEYKTIKVKGRFRSQDDVNIMDQLINESAETNWELVSTASLANSQWNQGTTNGMLLTFKRERGT